MSDRKRNAVVTGGGRGIGRAAAQALAAQCANVIVVTRSPVEPAEIFNTEGDHRVVVADLMSDGAVPALLDTLADVEVDILVNNLGGGMDVSDPFSPIEAWREVMRFNFDIAVEISNALIPSMRERGWGRVVNISSQAAVELNGPPTYAAAKAALCAYTRCVGRMIAGDGVVMTAVMPGVVETEGGYWEELCASDPDRVAKYLAERCPLGRFGKPEEVAAFVAFLASDGAAFCPGSVIPLDGGQLRGYAFG